MANSIFNHPTFNFFGRPNMDDSKVCLDHAMTAGSP